MTEHDILKIVKRNITRIEVIMLEIVNDISLEGFQLNEYPTFRDYFDIVSSSVAYSFVSRHINPKYFDNIFSRKGFGLFKTLLINLLI